MSRAPRVQRTCERVIRAACRRLPQDMRAERCREWAAELPAILNDQSIRPALRRAVRALTYSAGIARTTRQLSRAGRGTRPARTPQWRDGAMQVRPAHVAVRAAAGFGIWLLLVFLLIALGRWSQVSEMARDLDEQVEAFRTVRWTPGPVRSC